METVNLGIDELEGAALDWLIAEIDGQPVRMIRDKPYALFGSIAVPLADAEKGYSPSTCWHCGGPVLQKHRVGTGAPGATSGVWIANMPGSALMEVSQGSTPLIAACRRLVLEHCGKTVTVPAALIPTA